jgi:hypothetical protein
MSLWYFISIWGRSRKIIQQIWALIWASKKYTTCNMVKWGNCCVRNFFAGLGVVDPEEALVILLTKWVLHALQFGESNLQILFCHHINASRLNKRRKWGSNLNWALCHCKHIATHIEQGCPSMEITCVHSENFSLCFRKIYWIGKFDGHQNLNGASLGSLNKKWVFIS